MNDKNQQYLEGQLKFAGMGDDLFKNAAFVQLFEKGMQEVQFNMQKKIGDKEANVTLHFFKPDDSDKYFFRKFEIGINHPDNVELGSQTFFIDNKTNNKELQSANNFTLKEAFNLLEGRAVEKNFTDKDGTLYTTWAKLNFTDRDKWNNYPIIKKNFNLEEKLDKAHAQLTIVECNEPIYKNDLMNSLKRGNVQSVNIRVEGNKEKIFMAVDLAAQGFKYYDKNMSPIDIKQLLPAKQQSEKQSNGQGKSNALKNKTAKSDDEAGAKPQRQSRGARMS